MKFSNVYSLDIEPTLDIDEHFVHRFAQDVPRQRAVPENSRAVPAEALVQRPAGVRTPQQGGGILSGTGFSVVNFNLLMLLIHNEK